MVFDRLVGAGGCAISMVSLSIYCLENLVPHQIRISHMADYVDFAEYYEYDHAITEDIPFYLARASECGSPILELACGTGRVLIPLAQAGFEVHGIDISRNMLAACRDAVHRFGLDDRVRIEQADMTDFTLPRQDFKLIFAALRSFMHLPTPADQLACLRRAYAHLAPGGRLILNLIAPDPVRLAEAPTEGFAVRREFDLPNGNHVVRKQRLVEHDVAAQVRRFDFKFEERDHSGQIVRERMVPMSLRYSFRDELEDRLRRVGFVEIEFFRDYDGSHYDGTGEMVVVAGRPNGA